MTMRGFKPTSSFMGTASAFSLKRPGALNMKLNAQELEKIANLTLDCYNQNAEDFWEGTRAITTLARTSQRCCNTSRVNGLLQYSILAADPGVTLKSSPNSVTSQ